MTYSNRIDANQNEIVRALRDIGASVQPLNAVKQGCPDLLVGYRGQNLILEVKDGRKPPSARRLTPDEQAWFNEWRGCVYIVHSAMDAVTLVNKIMAADDAIPFS